MPRREVSKNELPQKIEFKGNELMLLFYDDDTEVKKFISDLKSKIRDFFLKHMFDKNKVYFYLIELLPLEVFVFDRKFEYTTIICSTEKLPFDKRISFKHPELGIFTGKLKTFELDLTQKMSEIFSDLSSEELEYLTENPDVIVDVLVTLVVDELELDVRTLMRKY